MFGAILQFCNNSCPCPGGGVGTHPGPSDSGGHSRRRRGWSRNRSAAGRGKASGQLPAGADAAPPHSGSAPSPPSPAPPLHHPRLSPGGRAEPGSAENPGSRSHWEGQCHAGLGRETELLLAVPQVRWLPWVTQSSATGHDSSAICTDSKEVADLQGQVASCSMFKDFLGLNIQRPGWPRGRV